MANKSDEVRKYATWSVKIQKVHHLEGYSLNYSKLFRFVYKGSLTDAPSTINWISAFSEFNRYMAIFRKFFESKRKCKCLIIITLPFWLVPCLFARFESFSSECIIPLDFNEFLFVRYMFQLRCKITHFSRKTCRMRYFLYFIPTNRIWF